MNVIDDISVLDRSRLQWKFFEDFPLFLRVNKVWLGHFAPKECRKWLDEHCEDVEVDYRHRYYRFPDVETKTEFLLRWS